jgi:hypothetical protein
MVFLTAQRSEYVRKTRSAWNIPSHIPMWSDPHHRLADRFGFAVSPKVCVCRCVVSESTTALCLSLGLSICLCLSVCLSLYIFSHSHSLYTLTLLHTLCSLNSLSLTLTHSHSPTHSLSPTHLLTFSPSLCDTSLSPNHSAHAVWLHTRDDPARRTR